jgi:hypothetical protein
LADIAALVRGRRLIEWLMERLVDNARGHGASWSEIGNALGVTRQAAEQRYGRAETHPNVPPVHGPNG